MNYSPSRYDNRFKWREEQRVKFINKLNLNPGKLLDVGCATGQFMRGMEFIGWEATGIDIDFEYLEYASIQGLEVSLQKIENYTSKKRYNLITLWGVLEHTVNPVKVVNIAWNLLGGRGYLIIEVPNANCLMNVYYRIFKPNKLFEWHYVTGHQHLFAARDIRKIIKETGFNIVELKTITYKDLETYKLNIRIKLGYWIRKGLTLFGMGDSIRLVVKK